MTGFLPAFALRAQPTLGEPVKLSNFKRSSSVNKPAPSRRHGKIENAPSGKFVSANISPINIAPMGVRLAGFKINGQPAAIAGATLCAAKFKGKLNGLINEQSPIGTRFVIPLYPLARALISIGITSPPIRVASSEAIRKVSIKRVTSPCASLMGFPASTHKAFASSSKRSLKRFTQ